MSGGDGVLGTECFVGCCTETVRAVPHEPDISGTDVPLNAKWPGCKEWQDGTHRSATGV